MRTDEGVNISERRSLRNVQTEFKLPSSSSSSSSAFRLPPGACQVDSTAISVSVRGQRLAANSASRPCVCVCVCVHACGQKPRPSLINTFKQEKEEIATGQLSPPLDVGQIGEKVCFVLVFLQLHSAAIQGLQLVISEEHDGSCTSHGPPGRSSANLGARFTSAQRNSQPCDKRLAVTVEIVCSRSCSEVCEMVWDGYLILQTKQVEQVRLSQQKKIRISQ